MLYSRLTVKGLEFGGWGALTIFSVYRHYGRLVFCGAGEILYFARWPSRSQLPKNLYDRRKNLYDRRKNLKSIFVKGVSFKVPYSSKIP